ncbi:Broad specificity phosphatase PhoE [Arboricoccus pini]|uniref:Broad specificity phosphatase PhoE n=1 Tax=Arboricoccus pini TaxID=1963835 RepID=A0A212QSS5_9PROT|nr:histidine phosphatase family protein [Arboricoccus pini]SNB62642.1 Broad specificity phosphatase PhoE [Arboricoccus pini]
MLLIRHAQSTWNLVFGASRIDAALTDPDLTESGGMACTAAAMDLKDKGLRRIVSSPYQRTLKTASHLAQILHLPIEVDVSVRERCAFSCDQGTPRSVLQSLWPQLEFGELEERWWGRTIESNPSLKRRAQAFLDRAARWDDHDHVLVVTHWGFIRCVTGLEVGNLATASVDPTVSTVAAPN